VGTPHYLYLAVPETSLDSSPSTVLVWHQREQGWTRWKNLSIVGGAGEVLAGRDGQLWLIGGSGDTTSAGGSLSAVTLTVQTRRVGDGSMFQQVGRLFCGVNVPGGSPASVGLSVLGDGANPASVTQSMSGESVVWVRVPGTAAGRKHDVSLSVASTERVRVRGLGLETFPARRI
jgi:hypothetical protein